MNLRRLAYAVAISGLPFGAWAHEFWIDPHGFNVVPDTALVADLRVGEDFRGSVSSYLTPRIRRFDVVMGDIVTPVAGRDGDRPALKMPVAGQGLAVVVHATSDFHVTYTEWEKFVSFARHKDFPEVLDQHIARGVPQEKFRERYSRYAKSLLAVGHGQGADREVGMETEIIALANPYTDALNGVLPVQVMYQGAVRPDVQVEIFAKAPDGEVTVSTARTDSTGRANVAVLQGHTYLVDAVVMRALPGDDDKNTAWESLWASLTFGMPPVP